MDVDHFQPDGKGRHRYTNLMVATRHCNGSKSDIWHTAAEERDGIYLINPYVEQDYGKHIYEDPETHHLLAVTRAGYFHINVFDLNAPHLVKERAKRSRIKARLTGAATFVGPLPALQQCLVELRGVLDSCIPEIPPVPDFCLFKPLLPQPPPRKRSAKKGTEPRKRREL